MRISMRLRAAAAIAVMTCTCAGVLAVPLTPEELTATCGDADGLAHCGRLVEAAQMKRFPNLAARDGDVLNVTLYPSGKTSFMDSEDPKGARSYSLWDYLDGPNIAVIYATRGDDATFLLLQRTNGRVFEVPAEPRLSPDAQRLATADVCAQGCSNEIAVWRVTRDGVRKESSWTPSERWTDAAVHWKSADAIELDYKTTDGGAGHTLERRLDARDWKRAAGR